MNIQNILDAKANLDLLVQEAVDGYLTHKDIPLEDRWALYEKISTLLPIASWVSDNAIEKTLGDVSLYDDFYIERHKTVLYVNIVESAEDDAEWYKDHPEETPRFTEEQLKTFKEHVLASGTQGFIFDW